MIKQFLKKITGIQLIEDAKFKARAEAEAALKIAEDAALAAKEALAAVERANKEVEIAKMTPKYRSANPNSLIINNTTVAEPIE